VQGGDLAGETGEHAGEAEQPDRPCCQAEDEERIEAAGAWAALPRRGVPGGYSVKAGGAEALADR